MTPLFEPLTAAGFVWFTIDSRLARADHFPASVEDVEAAIRYVQSHAREYKVDLKRIALTGESAGGHLVSFVGARDGAKLKIRAVIPIYAPIDLEALVVGQDKKDDAIKALKALCDFTEPNAPESIRRLREASPIKYMKKGMPPFLPIHGTPDELAAFRQSTVMREKIKAAGSSCELFPVEGAGHWEKKPAFQKYKTKRVEWLKETML